MQISFETVFGSFLDDDLDARTQVESVELHGQDGNDTLNGSDYNDDFYGGQGNDLMFGNGGNDDFIGDFGDDTLVGGDGADTMRGDSGNDHYFVTRGDVIVDTSGMDTVHADFNFHLADAFENLVLTGSTSVKGSGNSAANTISGNSGDNELRAFANDDTLSGSGGNDRLYGGSGYDRLQGGPGADWLRGGQNNDTLIGGNSDDTLNGGTGNDTLVGGSGADIFVFSRRPCTDHADTSRDFSHAEDSIHLALEQFGELGGIGALGAAAFALSTDAPTAEHRIIYDQSSGALYYDADGSGARTAKLFASVGAGLEIDATDFFAT